MRKLIATFAAMFLVACSAPAQLDYMFTNGSNLFWYANATSGSEVVIANLIIPNLNVTGSVIVAGNTGSVSRILAGSGISVAPSFGTGIVTVTAVDTNYALLNAANIFTGGRQTIKCGPGSSVSPSSLSDDLFIDCDELNAGLTIAPTNGGNGNIFFATQSRGNKAAFWQYFSASDLVRMGVANIDRLELRQTLSRLAVPIQIMSNIKTAPVKILAEFSSDGAAAPNCEFVMKNGTGTNFVNFTTNECRFGTKINMGGNSIINIGTNSLYFEDGTRVSVIDGAVCVNNGFTIGTNAITHKDVTNSVIQVSPGSNGGYFAQIDLNTRIKKLEIESDGFESKGRGKFKGADLEISDPFRGVIRVTTNSVGEEVKWGEAVIDHGDNTAEIQLIRLTYSPEMPFSNRVAVIQERQSRVNQSRQGFKKAGQLQKRIEWLENFIEANFDVPVEP